jgi:hypothetical protein
MDPNEPFGAPTQKQITTLKQSDRLIDHSSRISILETEVAILSESMKSIVVAAEGIRYSVSSISDTISKFKGGLVALSASSGIIVALLLFIFAHIKSFL